MIGFSSIGSNWRSTTCSDAFLLHAVRRIVALAFTIVSTWQWNANSSTVPSRVSILALQALFVQRQQTFLSFFNIVTYLIYVENSCRPYSLTFPFNLALRTNCGIALPLMRFQCSLHLRIHGQLFVAVCAFWCLPKILVGILTPLQQCLEWNNVP